MATRIPDAAQNAAADAVVDRIDLGAGAGTLKIFTGAQPADADTDPGGTLLVTVTLADPAYGAASAGSAALAGTPRSGTAAAAGTAGCFAVEDSNGANVFQGNVTATAGGGDLELDNTSIASGQTVNINSLSFSVPASE
jgi:hypothetical protein